MKNKYSKKENYRLWNIYHSMKKRCLNPNCIRHKDYGGRGILICEEWLAGFDAFAEWAYTSGYSDSMTIERKNNNGNYTPENCEWVTRERQSYNKRTSVMVMYKDEIKCLMDWCNELNLPYDTIHHRITHGWSATLAFETPVQNNYDSLRSKCMKCGISYPTVRDRIKKLGWDENRALNTPTLGLGANQRSYVS